MTNSDANTANPKMPPTGLNKEVSIKTQADCYKEAFTELLNNFAKKNKEESEALLIKLRTPPVVVRGEEQWVKEVRYFVKEAAALGENRYEKQF